MFPGPKSPNLQTKVLTELHSSLWLLFSARKEKPALGSLAPALSLSLTLKKTLSVSCDSHTCSGSVDRMWRGLDRFLSIHDSINEANVN